MDTALGILAVALLAGFIWAMRELKNARTERREFKDLFELGDSEYKKGQEQIQSLILAANEKDLCVERASQALDIAGVKMTEQQTLLVALDEKLRFSEGQYSKLLSQKKSSEVRTGMIAEQIAPFLEDYPADPATARFIGDPIDFVHFDEEKVTFVEVKSGKSQLSKKQRHIRDLIKDGKVDFTLYRIKGDAPPKKDDDDGNNGTN